jgi:hypothetical protein
MLGIVAAHGYFVSTHLIFRYPERFGQTLITFAVADLASEFCRAALGKFDLEAFRFSVVATDLLAHGAAHAVRLESVESV